MDELFGAPVSSIAQVLGVVFAIIALGLVFIVIRDNILVHMALRNVLRRPLTGDADHGRPHAGYGHHL